MSTITSTEPAQTSATHVNPTPTTIKVNLVCEDRDTAKKCLFKDLKAPQQPDNTIKVIDLIEKNISLQYFLNNCMIFQPSDDDMDIMIGFYPSEEIQNQYLSIDSKINITLKFEKIRTPSSESKKEENLSAQVNQNQISNNKNTNNNNNSINNNLHISSNKTNQSSEPHILQSKASSSVNENTSSTHPNNVSSPKLQNINQNLYNSQETCLKPEINTSISTGGAINNNTTSSQIIFGKAATASQLSNEDLNNNDSLTMSSHSLNMESEGCSPQLEPSAVSNPNNNLNDNSTSDKAQQNGNKKVKADSNLTVTNSQKGFKLNRKRKVSETLEHCSESCSNQNESKDLSPCTSFTENDVPKMKKHQSAITNDPTLSEAGETNNCFTNSMNLSLSGKLPINLYGQQGLNIGTHNSNFHAYNPLSNITNSSINNNSGFSAQSNCGGKQIEGSNINSFQYMNNQLHQQGGANSANSNSNNNNSNMNRQSRNKERTIREAIEMVTKWRDLQEEYRQKHQVKGLQEVADELNISKKVLDYYFQELRTAEFFGFDFDSNLGNKMGVLRKYIDEQKKNHEQKNKNFKITRNLQFKYRLKDYQSTSFLSNSSSLNINNGTNNMANSNANNNDALSSTSSQKSKEKFQQKQQSKIEQITSLLSSSVSNGQVKVEEMVIENENNFNFPSHTANNNNNINISGITTANSSSASTSIDLQKLLSKNSPNFLQFLNNSQTCTASNNANTFSSATSQSTFNNSNSTQLNANHSNSAQSSLSFLSNLANSAQGFSISSETTKKQQTSTQPQQSSQTNNGDKNSQFLDMLLYGNEKNNNSSINNNNNSSQQMDTLLISLFKMISQNDEPSNTDLPMPQFQKSHSASSSLLSNKFQDEDFLNKKRIAVIQIRKQDE
ncbi:hypothetical protein ABPG74_004994 [Tetrahymena malaccensis]